MPKYMFESLLDRFASRIHPSSYAYGSISVGIGDSQRSKIVKAAFEYKYRNYFEMAILLTDILARNVRLSTSWTNNLGL